MKNTLADCCEAMDMIYDDKDFGLMDRMRLNIHLFFCPRCSRELKHLGTCSEMMRTEFFPASPLLETKIMDQINSLQMNEEISAVNESAAADQESLLDIHGEPGGFSFRTWVIIGFFVFISLTSSFLGKNLHLFASEKESSFLVLLGITIGIMLSLYGAFFIGSHLKELTEHFKIHSSDS